MAHLRAVLALSVPLLVACAAAATPARDLTALPTFVSDRNRDHPLVGRWFDPSTSRFTELREVFARAVATPLVGIGETHDNADHHAVQALVLRTLIARGRHPAVVLEMVDDDRQAAIDEGRAHGAMSTEAFAALVDWSHSGWPPFAMYRPIVAAALDATLPLVAGDPPHAAMRALVMRGRTSLASAEQERLLLDRSWDGPAEASLRQELVDDHCGMLRAGSPVVEGMVLAERARDARLARHAIEARGDGAVLIAGSGHVRNDRGVPWAVHAIDPSQTMLSIGLVEVEVGKIAPDDYAGRYLVPRLPFDIVLFTPSPTRPDPCLVITGRHRIPSRI